MPLPVTAVARSSRSAARSRLTARCCDSQVAHSSSQPVDVAAAAAAAAPPSPALAPQPAAPAAVAGADLPLGRPALAAAEPGAALMQAAPAAVANRLQRGHCDPVTNVNQLSPSSSC